MKLPKVENADRYVGLYIVDFGDSSGVGFTAPEVAELLESEKFGDVTVYKIYNAYPDGRMELKGVSREIFNLESGMFFYAADADEAKSDYKKLVDLAVRINPPGRAKVHHAMCGEGCYVTALIYPAEYDDEFSRWLFDGEYKTAGEVHGGISAVGRYYESSPEVIERSQLFGESNFADRSGVELLEATKKVIQR